MFLQGNKYLTGFFYGQFVGMFMAFVVLPLSALPPSPFKLGNALISWTVLSVAIGIPVAMMTNKFYKSSTVWSTKKHPEFWQFTKIRDVCKYTAIKGNSRVILIEQFSTKTGFDDPF